MTSHTSVTRSLRSVIYASRSCKHWRLMNPSYKMSAKDEHIHKVRRHRRLFSQGQVWTLWRKGLLDFGCVGTAKSLRQSRRRLGCSSSCLDPWKRLPYRNQGLRYGPIQLDVAPTKSFVRYRLYRYGLPPRRVGRLPGPSFLPERWSGERGALTLTDNLEMGSKYIYSLGGDKRQVAVINHAPTWGMSGPKLRISPNPYTCVCSRYMAECCHLIPGKS